MKKAVIYVILGIVFLCLFSSIGLTRRRSSVRTEYKKARNEWSSYEKSPEKYPLRNLRKLAERFRRIYYKYPTSVYADDAVFFEAEIYRWLYVRTGSIDDWERAVRKYKFLIGEYPSSSLLKKAYVALAFLYYRRGYREWQEFLISCTKKFSKKACAGEELYRQLMRTVEKERQKKSHEEPTWESIRAQLLRVRFVSAQSYSRVILDVNNPIPFRLGILRNPDRLYVDLESTVLSKDMKHFQWKIPKSAHLKNIRVGQFLPDTARVVLDFEKIKKHRIFSLENPFRIVIDIFPEDWKPAGEVYAHSRRLPQERKKTDKKKDKTLEKTPAVPRSNSSGDYSIARQLSLKIRRIMIDPGHGGRDPGAIGYNGVKEKDVVLTLAKLLKKELEKNWDVEVFMTREDDRYIPLEERTAMANSKGADLFLSIHANASRNTHARGIETYYLHWAKNERAMEVAARENAVSSARMHELKKYVKIILQNTKTKESRDLARTVQDALAQFLSKRYRIKSLGVHSAPFYVLMGAEMPAILVEAAFITNPIDAKYLLRSDFQKQFVRAMIEGLKNYLKEQGSYALVAK